MSTAKEAPSPSSLSADFGSRTGADESQVQGRELSLPADVRWLRTSELN